jgi:hypothetical protein
MQIEKFLTKETQREALFEYVNKHKTLSNKIIQHVLQTEITTVIRDMIYDDKKFFKEYQQTLLEVANKQLKMIQKDQTFIEEAVHKIMTSERVLSAIMFQFDPDHGYLPDNIYKVAKEMFPQLLEHIISKDEMIQAFTTELTNGLRELISKTTVEKEIKRLLNQR